MEKKLYEQIKWLHEHENVLPLPKIISEDKEDIVIMI